jgi:1-acyl-sn-glycerol-3-phosphate acyltransferase
MVKQICTGIFKLTGWKYRENIPKELKSFVFIGAPHTSNYDFIPAMAVSYLMKRNAHFVIKKEWLKFPLGIFFKLIGGIGVERNALKKSKSSSSTDDMAKLFFDHEGFVLMIAPEGTRSPNANWKTGFYYIALKAKVPLVLGYANYKNKEAGLGLVLYPTDFEKDMVTITEFYKEMEGLVQENFLLDQRFK